MGSHPIRIVVEHDLRRSRLTVFFRLILAIPHMIWLQLWSIAVFFVAILSWFIVLFTGRLPQGLHNFSSAYIRYWAHLGAYIYLAANGYPGFVGDSGRYAIDLAIEEPIRQSRLRTAFRAFLAVPALLVMTSLVGLGPGRPSGSGEEVPRWWLELMVIFVTALGGGVLFVVAIMGWFASLALGRAPLGFRDLAAYALRYMGQTAGYLLFLTDRYPDADTNVPAAPQPTPRKPVRLRIDDDLRRSRLTVFFRLLLTIPHLIWLVLWGILVFFALIVGWFAALATGRLPDALHRFIGAYVRYETHVIAFLTLVGNPFPGFTGAPGIYPVDLEIDPRERQHRLKTLFRLFLAVPAHLLASALGGALWTVAFLAWFVGLFLGRMPKGLRNLGAYCLRYSAQTYAYLYLLTDSYPYSGPTDYVKPVPPWPGPLPLQSQSA